MRTVITLRLVVRDYTHNVMISHTGKDALGAVFMLMVSHGMHNFVKSDVSTAPILPDQAYLTLNCRGEKEIRKDSLFTGVTDKQACFFFFVFFFFFLNPALAQTRDYSRHVHIFKSTIHRYTKRNK